MIIADASLASRWRLTVPCLRVRLRLGVHAAGSNGEPDADFAGNLGILGVLWGTERALQATADGSCSKATVADSDLEQDEQDDIFEDVASLRGILVT